MTKHKHSIITATVVAATLASILMVTYAASNVSANTTVTYPAKTLPDMVIELNPAPFTLNQDGVYVLHAKQGDVVTIPMILKSQMSRTVHPTFTLTFGPGNESPVLPPGVHPLFNPASAELQANAQVASNLVLQIDKDAPNGKYPISVIAFAEGTDIGNTFQLIVGQGSQYEIGPNGPLIPPTVRAP